MPRARRRPEYKSFVRKEGEDSFSCLETFPLSAATLVAMEHTLVQKAQSITKSQIAKENYKKKTSQHSSAVASLVSQSGVVAVMWLAKEGER